MTRGRALAWVGIVGGLAFGVAGGEYATWDWWQLRNELGTQRAALDSLRIETDSLEIEVRLLERDPAAQERVARERYGMLRPGEIMFQVDLPDEP
ncbi:MAG: septum formation initiator family protein [Gemmatimonadota bacterium]|nr:septum formation initiator family protein [Gemmatimonadota bacterium]MDH5198031.1 septum formation initiator family protein [Gemmatimonadota bacterium]